MIKKSLLLIIIIAVAFISCEKKEEITYMGSRSCKECHEQFYELWETSYHGRAMMDFSLEFAEKELSKCDAYIPSGKDAYQ
ncbi:MAG: multiheme c-type cytochrome, partial [Candidatus Marinimicrobia bacterium]|nr:multiheme c-type cytochrome [Candidatus Neomarinimicrobiota bacterium]